MRRMHLGCLCGSAPEVLAQVYLYFAEVQGLRGRVTYHILPCERSETSSGLLRD